MQAVVIRDEALVWEQRDDPVPGDTEVLVAVRAAGLNGADLVQRRGFYPAPPGSPQDIPGMELAGEVTAVGRQVTRVAVGARVMAVVGGGGQATMCVVDESHVIPVPDGLGWPEAGGFPEVFSTAYDALFSQAALSSGDRVLVTGAAGGVGTAGVQLGAATGATVVASVRDEKRRGEVADLGAHHVIDPAEVAAHGPYDVVLELVGAPSLETALPYLATGARVVVIGMGAGSSLSLNLFSLMSTRSRISGSTLRARSRTEKANVAAGVIAHVLPHLASGRISVPIHQTFAMSEAAAAYEHFAAGSKLGKIVLVA
jgi:NADPH:quinone reductase-like Zn-dependent oxidoreductase